MRGQLFFKNPRILAVLLFGFSSGLPFALTSSTLQAWFTQSGVSLKTIGIMSLIGIPYIWKFLWSPLVDKMVPPFLGRRRGWIGLTQLVLCIAVFLMAQMNPTLQPKLIVLLALLIAFVSATQDIAIDAYRTDILLPEERGIGVASFNFSYRIAILVAGGLALVLADFIGWRLTYECMAILFAGGAVMTMLSPDPTTNINPPRDFAAAIKEPFKDLFQRPGILWVLLFIVFYKFGDALALTLMSNFLLHGLGFSLTEVGIAYKTVGLLASIMGAFAGGLLLSRLDLYRALLYFGLAQAFSNLFYMLLAAVGKHLGLMASAMFIENFCSGMSTAALLVFMTVLCHQRYSATQFACLSALAALGRVFLGPVAAVMVEHLGWTLFYGWSVVLCFPGLFLLMILRGRMSQHVEAFS